MKNKHFYLMVLFFCYISTALVFPEDIFYRVLRETILYYEDVSIYGAKPAGTITIGEKVRMVSSFFLDNSDSEESVYAMVGTFSYPERKESKYYDIFANDLVPFDTEDIMEPGMLTRFSGSYNKKWIISTLVDMLKTKRRDSFLEQNVYFNEMYNPANGVDPYGNTEWYEFLANFVSMNSVTYFFISNSAIYTEISIWLTNIKKNNQGYTLVCGTTDEIREKEVNWLDLDWSPISGKERNFTMTLKIDGDFMDVYLENEPTKFATYEFVEQKIVDEIVKLLDTDSCDLTGVNWPLRASDLGGTGLIYRTIDRLKLRKSESRSSNVIRTLDIGAGMILLSKGTEETIDGITSSWVQVKTETGETGWCFGGYLDPRP